MCETCGVVKPHPNLWTGGRRDEGILGAPQARAKTNQLSCLPTGGHWSLSRKRIRQMVSHKQGAWEEYGNFSSSERMSFLQSPDSCITGRPFWALEAMMHTPGCLADISVTLLIVLLASSPPVAYTIYFPPFLPSFGDSFIHSWHRIGGREKWEAALDDHTEQQWLLSLPVFRLSAVSKSQFKEFCLMNLLLSAPKDSHLLPPLISTVLMQTPLVVFATLYYYLIPRGILFPTGQWTLTGQGLVLTDF